MDKVLEQIRALDSLLASMERVTEEENKKFPAGLSVPEDVRKKEEASWESIQKKFNDDFREIIGGLNSITQEIRGRQPELSKMSREIINAEGAMPDYLAMGKYHVKYGEREWDFPRTVAFPVEKPMYIAGKEHFELFQKILFRLMFALPVDRQEYYIYDPVNLGEALVDFNCLYQNETLFPQKRVMISQKELKDALKEVIQYINSLYQSSFDNSQGISNWKTYNESVYKSGDLKKVLPYKVFVFADLPGRLDQETFDMIRTIMEHSCNCGFLVLFSFHENIFKAEDTMRRQMVLDLKEMVDRSLPLHEVFDQKPGMDEFDCLSVEVVGDKMPDAVYLGSCLNSLDEVVKRNVRSLFSFGDLLDDKSFQTGVASEKLSVPVGFTASGGKTVCMEIGDAAPHYLVGGITGSGKSNFLHTLITSACWKYSAKELELYLLDFKEGVEFKQYADLKLANARLVATEADREFGVSVLEHLDRERARRYAAFKKKECKNITAYNYQASQEGIAGLPRILVIIDEFQVLLGTGTSADSHVMSLFTMLAKQGRACGIHMVLSTQSLAGLSFGDVETQFGGRIALKCSSEDSKRLLGGIASSNEEASQLQIPFAIMNISQGNVSGNIRFAVPCAVPSKNRPDINPVEDKIKKINEANKNQAVELKVFEGQKAPEYPDMEAFRAVAGAVLTLGKTLDFESAFFRINLKEKPENNLLVCGKDADMKKNLIKSCILSAAGNPRFDSCIYVGDSFEEYGFSGLPPVLECFESVTEFMEAQGEEDLFETTKLVILDNCNLAKEIAFPSPGRTDVAGNRFMEFWGECNRNGSFLVVFYDGAGSMKNSGIRGGALNAFGYRIGFSLNDNEIQTLLENSVNSRINCTSKAFCVYDLKQTDYFRPFAEGYEE